MSKNRTRKQKESAIYSYNPKSTARPTSSTSIQVTSPSSELYLYDYALIQKDLKKTLFYSVIILVIQLLMFFSSIFG